MPIDLAIQDQMWMGQCLALAQQAAGRTAPNPLVGSVIVQGSEQVGAGFHAQAGQPHAEIMALRAAGDLAQGATLYVNLEPCNHQGRTPPCTQAIVSQGIQRVVIGMIDPNPRVCGQGVHALESAGIQVTTGVLEAECQKLNEAFSHCIVTGRPWGIWKYAMTLDGKTATVNGDSFWVSGEAARAQVQQLRNVVDGVIVGGQTIRRDDPRLTCRIPGGRNPKRIILSRSLDLPRPAQVWHVAEAPTLVFTGPGHDPTMAQFLENQGVTVHVLSDPSPLRVMEALGHIGLTSVLWEAGGNLMAQALAQGLVQKVLAYISPKLSGGLLAPTPLAGAGSVRMAEALNLKDVTFTPVGADFLVSGYISAVPALDLSPL